MHPVTKIFLVEVHRHLQGILVAFKNFLDSQEPKKP